MAPANGSAGLDADSLNAAGLRIAFSEPVRQSMLQYRVETAGGEPLWWSPSWPADTVVVLKPNAGHGLHPAGQYRLRLAALFDAAGNPGERLSIEFGTRSAPLATAPPPASEPPASEPPGPVRDDDVQVPAVPDTLAGVHLSLDLDPAPGDQGRTQVWGAVPGTAIPLQIWAHGLPTVIRARLELSFAEPIAVSGDGVASGDLIPNALPVVVPLPGGAGVDLTLLRTAVAGGGSGLLATVELRVEADPWEDVAVRARRLEVVPQVGVLRLAPGEWECRVQGARRTDFDASGRIDASDFMLMADAFLTANPRFDLDASGRVDYDDLFRLFDTFGHLQAAPPVRAKASVAGPAWQALRPGSAEVCAQVQLERQDAGTADPRAVRVAVRATVGTAPASGLAVALRYDADRLRIASRVRHDGVAGPTAGTAWVAWVWAPGGPDAATLRFEAVGGGPAAIEVVDGVALGPDGAVHRACPASLTVDTAPETGLSSAFPNPFNGATRIAFRLDAPSPVDLAIYDILGQRVRSLVAGWRDAGRHAQVWDGTDARDRPVAAGIYYARLVAGRRVWSQGVVLAR